MTYKTIIPALCLFMTACLPEKGAEVLIKDGTYFVEDIYIPGVGDYSTIQMASELLEGIDLPEDILDFNFEISTAENTFNWGASESDLSSSTIEPKASEDWETACQTNFTAVSLETFSFDTETIAFGVVEITSPILHADGCVEERLLL